MGPIDFIIIAVIVLALGGAIGYIVKAKKSGQKCIGCPDSKTCHSKESTCGGKCSECNCCSHVEEEN